MPKPKAEATHRRKGVPLKSIKSHNLSAAEIMMAALKTLDGDDPANVDVGVAAGKDGTSAPPALSNDDSGVLFRQPGGVRRRKGAAPARSL